MFSLCVRLDFWVPEEYDNKCHVTFQKWASLHTAHMHTLHRQWERQRLQNLLWDCTVISLELSPHSCHHSCLPFKYNLPHQRHLSLLLPHTHAQIPFALSQVVIIFYVFHLFIHFYLNFGIHKVCTIRSVLNWVRPCHSNSVSSTCVRNRSVLQ